MCRIATVTKLSPGNGTFPLSSSYRTAPSPYTSLCASALSPFACSGEM